jgi:hemerythrin
MKKTIELIDEQHAALVQVIQFLDSHSHSDEPVREAVDKILNHSDDLIRKSDEEIKQAREVLKRYEYDDEY